MLPHSCFALVVGGGPTALVTAILLARYGFTIVVVERHPLRLGQPKANVINARSAEIFRQFGLETSQLRAKGLDPEESRRVIFGSSMFGVEFGFIDREEFSTNDTPEPTFGSPQPVLEEVLLEIAKSTGKVIYLRENEWLGCTESSDKIITSVVRYGGDNTERTITSKYLIGCDGIHSKTREVLNVKFDCIDEIPDIPQHYMSIHFRGDLSHSQPALLHIILDPSNLGVLIPYNRKNEWVFMTQCDPTTTTKEIYTHEYCRSRIIKAVGCEVECQILENRLWTTATKIASSFRSKTMRNAFLAGDAAHCFPPTGGLGMNTGIADAHNLTWKILAVERGWAKESFLDTFTTERRQVAESNARHSASNETKMLNLTKLVFQNEMSAQELMENSVMRTNIEDAILDNSEHFQSLNMHIGYVYGHHQHTRKCSDYQKESVSGARLPHAWVKLDGQTVSTLDLIDGFNFVLIASEGFTTLSEVLVNDIPVRVQQLGRDFTDSSEGTWTTLMKLSGEQHGVL
ncbi:FAD-binding family [Pochonia chlamydosporia 170]|uniref:FAD-binding family n=1 Tax=Pochonia chlamydosporia 170 TaxID=1380566 RepID=A0A179FBC9_METCM|nr:FAD-binding family [Pochonia chlamydosporia 170]OAQ62728.2 FAD-binding family [Pochonia chlamydosporia 170]